MNRADRAKQFMPFDALKGLREALRQKEEIISRIERIELTEEDAEKISSTLIKISKGDEVSLKFFKAGHYINYQGVVTSVNKTLKFLTVNDIKIYFEDIYTVKQV